MKSISLNPGKIVPKQLLEKGVSIRYYFIATVSFLTLAIVLSLLWNLYHEKKEVYEMACTQARALYKMHVIYRSWNAGHGGVYVPITEETQPNIYLSDKPDQDVTTLSGKNLTKINPAFMTRQVNELIALQLNFRGHITSLKPIRPENAPDPWEKKALQDFEKGEQEFSSIEEIEGNRYIRFMKPLFVKEVCLKCHAKQGYKIGDIRGGISVSVPMEPLLASSQNNINVFFLTHGIFWILALSIIVWSSRQLQSKITALSESERFTTTLMSNLPGMAYRCKDDSDCTMEFVSKGSMELTGYSQSELLNNNISSYTKLIHADDRKKVLNKRLVASRRNKPFQLTYRIKTGDGKIKWLWEQGQGIASSEGELIAIEGFISDVTKRIRVEEELRKNEATLHSIFRAAPTGIGLVSNRILKKVNDRMCEMLGYTRDELVEKSARMLYPDEEEYERVGKIKYSQIKKRGTGAIETRWKQKNGEVINVLLRSTFLDPANPASGVTFTAMDITSQTQVKEALIESEEKFRNLAEQSPNMIFINKNGQVVYANKRCEEVMDFTQDEFYSSDFDFLSIIAPEHRDLVVGNLPKHKKGEDKKPYVYSLVTKNGKKIEAIINSKLIDYQGERAILRIVTDITELKRAADKIRNQNKFLNIILESLSDPFYVIDANNYNIVLANSAVGLDGSNAPSTCYAVTHKNNRPCGEKKHPCPLKIVKKTKKSITLEHLHYDKNNNSRIVEVHGHPIVNENGEVTQMIEFTRDITERKNTEKKLKKAHKETEQLLSSLSSILIGVEENDLITRWNSIAEEVFDIPAASVIGKPFISCGINWDWPEILERIAESREMSKSYRWEDIRYTKRNGQVGFLDVTVNPIVEKSSGFLLIATEVTERKNLESKLRNAQKLESIGQLAAGIAHEINTPIQYVGDNIRFIHDAFNDLDELLSKYNQLIEVNRSALNKKYLGEIDEIRQEADVDYLMEEIPQALEQSLDGTERVAKIVRAMKEFSHPGKEDKTLVDINKALETTITVSRNEWKYVAEMVTDFDLSLPAIPCYPGELNQVFLNVIVNAAQAIADVLGEETGEKGEITVSTQQNGNWVEIQIGDTGKGIPEEIISNIFDPFFTTKEVGKGTGQGLAISHDVVVNKHDGILTFDTEIGKGTSFIIRLPLNDIVE